MSHRPGMRNLPRPSILVAFFGTEIFNAFPTSVILAPVMITVWSATAVPFLTSMTVICVMAVKGPDLATALSLCWAMAKDAKNRNAASNDLRFIFISYGLVRSIVRLFQLDSVCAGRSSCSWEDEHCR